MKFSHVKEGLFPCFRHQWNELFLRCIVDSRSIGSSLSISACVSSDTFSLNIFSMLNGTIWIPELLRKGIPLRFLDSLSFLELIHWLLPFGMSCSLFSTFLSFCSIQSLIYFFVDTVRFHAANLSIDILLQVFFLNSFPFISVELDGFKGIFHLIRSELSILTHSVEANNISLFLSLEGLGNNVFPLTRVVNILLLVSLAVILTISLLLFVLLLLLLLLSETLLHT